MTEVIPPREPIGDPFIGQVVQIGAAQILTLDQIPLGTVLASKGVILRYGLRFLGKLHLSIVPGLVVLDYGEILTGNDAWDFLLKQSNAYPRAEVVGYRNDGVDDMILVRALDIAVPPEVLAYAHADATTPFAKPTALIASSDDRLPARLVDFLPCFSSLDEWQRNTSL